MTVGRYCNREVNVVYEEESILDAARLMRKYHVGDLVIVRDEDNYRVPLGIITDRDIVLEIDTLELDPKTVAVGDAMSFDLISIEEGSDLVDACQLMRKNGVRRLPVVGKRGELVGIITADDIIRVLSEQLTNLTRMMQVEAHHERERCV